MTLFSHKVQPYHLIYIDFNSLFDRDMKVYNVTQVLKQGFNIKTNCPNYIPEFRNMKSHLL